jgi:hypothetical protein
MPYTSEARKAQYLSYRECSISATEVARRVCLAASTARDVWRRAGKIKALYSANNLPPLSIERLVAVKPKTGRPKVLTNIDYTVIFAACTVSKKACRKQ